MRKLEHLNHFDKISENDFGTDPTKLTVLNWSENE